jgi:hypothetical protein
MTPRPRRGTLHGMGKVSRESAEKVQLEGPFEDRSSDLHGYTVGFLAISESIDGTELLKGLPGDQCHCPHWGYVFKGRWGFRFEGRDEWYGPGDAFYIPPGHIPFGDAGTEVLLFSPADALKATDDAILANLERLKAAQA